MMLKLKTTIPLRYWQLFVLLGLSGYAVGVIAAKIMNAIGT
ncbi:hypothetical protein FIU90_09900 [Erythrobacter sp. THAF29]|nr:hypothetical protein FIU90_09900 [Erythrobacter sp. THAF29]